MATPFTLEVDNGKYFIGKKPAVLRDNGRWECVDEGAKAEKLMSVTIPPYPHYYDHHTSRGHSMRSIMPIAGDFGGATIFPHCHYFGRFVDDYRHTECRFCGIDENLESGRDIFPKRPDDFLETVAEARKYPYFRHGPVFAGGTTPPPDRGAKAHAKFLRPLKDAFPDNWLRLTIAPRRRSVTSTCCSRPAPISSASTTKSSIRSCSPKCARAKCATSRKADRATPITTAC